MMSPAMMAETIAKALGGCTVGGGWMARCPANDDGSPVTAVIELPGNMG